MLPRINISLWYGKYHFYIRQKYKMCNLFDLSIAYFYYRINSFFFRLPLANFIISIKNFRRANELDWWVTTLRNKTLTLVMHFERHQSIVWNHKRIECHHVWCPSFCVCICIWLYASTLGSLASIQSHGTLLHISWHEFTYLACFSTICLKIH